MPMPAHSKPALAAMASTAHVRPIDAPGKRRVRGALAKNDAGFYETTHPLACTAELSSSDASTTAPSTKSGDADRDSGCSMPPRALGDLTLLATPFGLGLVVALRRTRRR